MFENKGASAITATAAPTFYKLAQTYTTFTNYTTLALNGRSLPDYAAMTTGSYAGCGGSTDIFNEVAGAALSNLSNPPKAHSNIFSQVQASSRTWKAYEEGVNQGSNYTTWEGSGAGLYATRHCPAAWFTATNAQPGATQKTNGRFDFRGAGGATFISDITNQTLPDFFYVTPDLNNDAHNQSITYADNWLAGKNPEGNSPAFPGVNALINAMRPDGVLLITFDNAGPTPGAKIYATVVGQNVPNVTNSTHYTHCGMLWGIQVQWGLSMFSDSDLLTQYSGLGTAQAFPWPTFSSGGTPNAPGTVTVGGATQSSLTVSWTKPSGTVPISGYQVWGETGGTAFTEVGSPTSSPFTVTGLTASTVYDFYVQAANGTVTSANSGTVAGTTLASGTVDTIPPTAPTNLTSTATSSSTISLGWDESTDNTGVSGYQVWRSG